MGHFQGKRQVSVHTGVPAQVWAGGDDPRLRLGRLQESAHRAPAFLEQAALFGEGDTASLKRVRGRRGSRSSSWTV